MDSGLVVVAPLLCAQNRRIYLYVFSLHYIYMYTIPIFVLFCAAFNSPLIRRLSDLSLARIIYLVGARLAVSQTCVYYICRAYNRNNILYIPTIIAVPVQLPANIQSNLTSYSTECTKRARTAEIEITIVRIYSLYNLVGIYCNIFLSGDANSHQTSLRVESRRSHFYVF